MNDKHICTCGKQNAPCRYHDLDLRKDEPLPSVGVNWPPKEEIRAPETMLTPYQQGKNDMREAFMSEIAKQPCGKKDLDKNTLSEALKESAQYALGVHGISFFIPDKWPKGVRDFYLELYDQMMRKCSRFARKRVDECKCVYEGEPHAIEFINSPSGKQWAIGGTHTKDRFKFCPWCGGAIVAHIEADV